MQRELDLKTSLWGLEISSILDNIPENVFLVIAHTASIQNDTGKEVCKYFLIRRRNKTITTAKPVTTAYIVLVNRLFQFSYVEKQQTLGTAISIKCGWSQTFIYTN